MQRLEIKAHDVEEAKIKAFEQGITVLKDVTNAWRRNGKPLLAKSLDAFAMNMLDKDDYFAVENIGIIIEIKKRKRPPRRFALRMVNYPKKGPRPMNKTVEIRNLETDELMAVSKNKKLAMKKAREIVQKYEIDVYGVTKYVPVDRDFELYKNRDREKYKGEYLVFYVDEKDVRLYKQRFRNF